MPFQSVADIMIVKFFKERGVILILSEVLEKQKRYELARDTFPKMTIASYEKAFEIEFAHNSTAIDGNTLTLMETKWYWRMGLPSEANPCERYMR